MHNVKVDTQTCWPTFEAGQNGQTNEGTNERMDVGNRNVLPITNRRQMI